MSENVFDKAKILDEEWSKVLIGRLSSRPNAKTAYGSGGYDAKAMKAAFDAQGNLLKERHNTLVNYARAEEGARAAAETKRQSDFENAEAERQNTFEAAEAERQNTFVQNETSRANAFRSEQERREISYSEAENARQKAFNAAEKTRNDGEVVRIANDEARGKRIDEIEALVGDVDSALNAIIAIQESLIGGGA